jgi:xylulokinase
MIFAGIDVGTTRCKLTLFDDGKPLASFQERYQRTARNHSESVIDPEEILACVKKIIIQAYKSDPRLTAIGLTSFGEAFVLLDKNDRPLYESMLYSDPRGREEAKELQAAVSDEKLAEITGQTANPMFSLSKLLYLKKHHPEIYQRGVRLCLVEDYLVYMLTGVQQIDYALACRTQAFDIRKLEWSSEILDKFNVSSSLFSRLVEVGTNAGLMKKEVASELGIPDQITVITGAHDQIAAALGVGLWEEGDSVDGAGTCECLTPLYSDLSGQKQLCYEGFGIIPYPKKNTYVSYGMITTGGALLEWYLDKFCQAELQRKEDPYLKLNEQLSAKPTDVFVLPYFAGSGCPYMDPLATGALVNLSLGTSREEIYQAVLESLAYEMRLLKESLKADSVPVRCLLVSGGGALNDKWTQIKADVLNLPYVSFENHDAGTVGSGIIIGKALGLFKDFPDGIEKMVKVKHRFLPNQERSAQYEEKYQRYLKLYRALKPLESK